MTTIRVIGPDDWLIWRKLRLEALRGAPEAFGSGLATWENASEERWRTRLNVAQIHNIMAFNGDVAVGMAAGVRSEDSTVVDLISMWVSPDARGQGVGDALIDHLGDWAARQGAECLKLEVVVDNDHANKLYLRNGFVISVKADDGSEQTMIRKLSPDARRSAA